MARIGNAPGWPGSATAVADVTPCRVTVGVCGCVATMPMGAIRGTDAPTGWLADVDVGATHGNRFGFAQDLAGDRCGLTLSEEQEAGGVGQGMSLCP